MKKMRPPQIENLLEVVATLVEKGNFRFSEHAIQRRKERRISPQDAVYILKTGYHEKQKTSFDEIYKTWKYAIRGKTLDREDVRVIIPIVEKLIVITVIRLK